MLPTRSRRFASASAAREAAHKDGFVREVDDALREEELLTALRRYAVPVGAAIAAGLIALGGWLWWTGHQADVRAGQDEQITLAMDKLDAGSQDAAFAQLAPVAAEGDSGNRAVARMLQAGIATRQGKVQDAARLFNAVASDSSAPQPYRDLATIRAVAVSFDTLAPPDAVARLRPLAVPEKPFFGSAGELLGIAYLREGRRDLAAALFGAIAHDAGVPESLRSRARQMAGSLGVDAVDDVTRGAAPASAPQS